MGCLCVYGLSCKQGNVCSLQWDVFKSWLIDVRHCELFLPSVVACMRLTFSSFLSCYSMEINLAEILPQHVK